MQMCAETVVTLLIAAMLYGVEAFELEDASTENLHAFLVDHFSQERSPEGDETKYKATRKYLQDYFRGLDDELGELAELINQEFTFLDTDGLNIILIFSGENEGTSKDRPVLLGAHYDTVKDTTGVDDNGSGMAALLEASRIIAAAVKESNSKPENTMLLVAFDMEEWYKNSIATGSRNYVNSHLGLWLKSAGIPSNGFQGALILETIMNFNDTEGSEILPPAIAKGIPVAENLMKNNKYRGNFLSLLHRIDDSELVKAVTQEWSDRSLPGSTSNEEKYKLFNISLPANLGIKGRPNNWNPMIHDQLDDFLRSDHAPFWDYDGYGDESIGLKALFITDTANFRSPMKDCYHKRCDNIETMMTDDNLEFLTITTDVMARTMLTLGGVEYTVSGSTLTSPPPSMSLAVVTSFIVPLINKLLR